MVGPEEVDGEGIEAIGFELLEDVRPQFWNRQSLVVKFSRVYEDPGDGSRV